MVWWAGTLIACWSEFQQLERSRSQPLAFGSEYIETLGTGSRIRQLNASRHAGSHEKHRP